MGEFSPVAEGEVPYSLPVSFYNKWTRSSFRSLVLIVDLDSSLQAELKAVTDTLVVTYELQPVIF